MEGRTRIRIRFTKTGKVRWTSHRDLARIWERAIRRVGLPVAYSEGFSPRPKVHFGLALSTGHESTAEFLDVDLLTPGDAPLDLDGLADRLSAALPAGIGCDAVAVLPERTPSLQEAVTSCTWRIEVRDVTPADLAAGIDRALAAPELVLTRQRKGKDVTDDVRPYLLDLAVVGPTDAGAEIEAHLATQPRGLRSAELLAVLGDGTWVEGRVRRTHQWTLHDGARREPLAPRGATSAPHAGARAS